MAKTALNKKVDDFFKKYGKAPITKEIVASSNLDIHEINEYGNTLHALVNYKYPEKRVLELMSILMDMGIDVNKRGKSTGLTFIHLSLYGYTDESNRDHSYSQEFIIELINLARKHGLDVNIKDSDSETIADAAIASEIYTGEIKPIFDALGPSFEIGEANEKKFEYYLKSSSGSWHKRLQDEEKEIRNLIRRSQLNPETVCEELEKTSKELNTYTQNIDYPQLKEIYKNINDCINKLKSLLTKSADLELDTTSYQNMINDILNNVIAPIIEREISNIEKKPNDNDIKILTEIITSLSLADLLEKIKSIASHYQAYKEELMRSANNVSTINEGKALKNSIKETEIYDELTHIIDEKINSLRHLISSIQELSGEIAKTIECAQDFINVEKTAEEYDYEGMTSSQLEKIMSDKKQEKNAVHNSIIAYITMQYRELKQSLMPLINAGIITDDDFINSFNASQSQPMQKGKK